MSASDVKWVRLGDYISQCTERNISNKYGIEEVRGVKNSKGFIKTKADVSTRDLSSFRILKPGSFAFNRRTTRNGERLGLGYNDSEDILICTEDYIVFRVKPEYEMFLDSRFLYLCFLRDEFDRYSRYDSWGSATEFFNWEEMCRVQIPLPDIIIQKELVAAYNGLKQLAEENEALIEPLQNACQAYVVDCKVKYPMVKLGEYIEEENINNEASLYGIDDVKGISTDKCFIDTKANLDGVSLNSYKVVNPMWFAYVADTSRRGEKIALALNTGENGILISSIYTTFKCKKEIDPSYLYILLSRSEFDRYSRFHSWGSARETFDWADMCRVDIPLPPIEVQEAIVDLYQCLEEAKKISSLAREQLKTLCPALVQRASKN